MNSETEMCLHPSLLCDGHPQCPQAEDEQDCEREYIQKKIIKPYATYKCNSIIYEGIIKRINEYVDKKLCFRNIDGCHSL